MKRNHLILMAALLAFALLAGACTRSASGGPSETADNALPNPVSTQSQVMKDIIAATQTAMAVPLDATAAPAGDGTAEPKEAEAEVTLEATAEPEVKEPTAKPLPTSTAGPPPEVELAYNAKQCAPGMYLCIVEFKKDQTVTVQATYPWLLNNMELTFKMGPEGNYDFTKYIVAGTATYKPDASKGYGFRTTLTIPDGLRGAPSIVVLLETNDKNYYGSDFFANK